MQMIAGRCFLVTDQNGTYSSGANACKEESMKLAGKWDGGLAIENEHDGVTVKSLLGILQKCTTFLARCSKSN